MKESLNNLNNMKMYNIDYYTELSETVSDTSSFLLTTAKRKPKPTFMIEKCIEKIKQRSKAKVNICCQNIIRDITEIKKVLNESYQRVNEKAHSIQANPAAEIKITKSIKSKFECDPPLVNISNTFLNDIEEK